MPKREAGYVIKSLGRDIMEFFGPDAELQADAWLHVHRWEYGLDDFRIEPTWRTEGTISLDVAGLGIMSSNERLERMTTEQDARQEGYSIGNAFARIAGISATADFEALTTLGMFFAQLQGYRELRTGNSYVTGFIKGFQDQSDGQNPKRITNGE